MFVLCGANSLCTIFVMAVLDDGSMAKENSFIYVRFTSLSLSRILD